MRTKIREQYKSRFLQIEDYGKLSKEYKNGKIRDIYFILKVPPTPPSYTSISIITSSFEFEGAFINNLLTGMDPTPLFEEARNHNITMITSSLRGLEEIGSGVNPKLKETFNQWDSFFISQGGESVTDSVVEYLRQLFNVGNRKFMITTYANSEGGVLGEGPTSKYLYAYGTNFIFILTENGERIALDKAKIGTLGELVLTTLIRTDYVNRDISPILINYNTHDLIKVVDRKEEGLTVFSFEGRADKIYRVGGSAKIDESLALDLLYRLKAINVEDGTFQIKRNGLKDQLVLIYSGEAPENAVKKALEEKLMQIAEFSYAISTDALDVSAIKGKIEATPGKKKVLADLRI
jgi:hypothetical protein